MLPRISSQKMPVVQAGVTRKCRTSESGFGFIVSDPSQPESLRLRGYPFDELRRLRVRALAYQGRDRDLVAGHLVDVPDDHPVDAGLLDIADLQLGLDHRDIAGDELA